MNDEQFTTAIKTFKELSKESDSLVHETKALLRRLNAYDEDDEDEEDDIDKLKGDLELAYSEHAITLSMVHKVYLGEAKIVYGVYTDGISFEDNDGEFLW